MPSITSRDSSTCTKVRFDLRAKVGSTVLSRVIQRLPAGSQREDVLLGLDAPDDSAMLAVPAGKALVQSVDPHLKLGDLLTESFGHLGIGGLGVFDRVVKKRGREGRIIHLLLGEDHRHSNRMGKIGFT